jgi:integrase
LAVVTIGGHNHYLGPFGSSESHARYAALIAEWQRSAASETRLSVPSGPSFTIAEMALAYLEFARRYYTKNGEPTSQIYTERAGLRALIALYQNEHASAFGPLKLKNIQQHLVGRDLCRSTINSFSAAIKRAFKWAASEELIPESVSNGLRAVGGLKRGRSGAKEAHPVRPVDEGTVSATIPHLSPVVAAMVRLQLLTGMRPGEVCRLRPADLTIQKSGTWAYRPATHKSEHHAGRERRVFIGPEGQRILRPYLERDPDAFCFNPRESFGRAVRAAAKRRPGSRYTSASYRRAISRACELAFEMPPELRTVPKTLAAAERHRLRLEAARWRDVNCWQPNQLRHSAATMIRERYGMEAAATVLGHSDPRVTAIYAERDFKLASDVIQKIG